MRIAIIGGGIAGLSAAFWLLQRSSTPLEIVVFEKNETCGGLARSSRDAIQSQYCWHVFGAAYTEWLAILETVLARDGKSVRDHLVRIENTLVSDGKQCWNLSSFSGLISYVLHTFDFTWLSRSLWQLFRAHPDELRDLTFVEFLNSDQSLTEEQVRVAIEIWSPILGVDPFHASASSVVEVLQSNPWFTNQVPFSVLDGPSTLALFDRLVDWLESHPGHRVRVLTEHDVTDVRDQGDRIVALRVRSPQGAQWISGFDSVLCAAPPLHTAKLLPETRLKHRLDRLGRAMALKQVSIPLYLSKHLHFGKPATVFLIPDSAWQIIVEPIANFWASHYMPGASCLEVGLGNPYKPGTLTGKPWPYCTLAEIVDEIWHEIRAHFARSGCITDWEDVYPVFAIMWQEFEWQDDHWVTDHPKCSPNAGTWRLRPSNPQDGVPWSNLWLAGDYMQGPSEVTDMESAAASGKRAALHLLEHQKLQVRKERVHH